MQKAVYLDSYLMPGAFKGDSLHLAYATFKKCDSLLAWNCNYLANANKRQHIRIISARFNLPTPELVTPLELLRRRTMLTNEPLRAKYRAQRALAAQGGEDLQAYAQDVRRIVREVERKHRLKFHCQRSQTAAVTPAKPATSSSCGPRA